MLFFCVRFVAVILYWEYLSCFSKVDSNDYYAAICLKTTN